MAHARTLGNVQIARGLAATMVVIQHCLDQMRNHAIFAMRPITIYGGAIGGNGVDIFFVISGFTMVYITTGEMSERRSPIEFFKRRMFRVAPTYWIFTALMVATTFALPGAVDASLGSWWHVMSSFIFIPSARADGLMHPVLGLGWTLNYEFFFYTCFTISLLLPASTSGWLLSAAFVGLASIHPLVPSGPLAFWSDPIILEFLFGMALARVFRAGWRLSSAPAVMLGVAGVILSFAGQGLWREGPRFLISGVPSLMIVGAFALAQQRIWWRPLLAIGDASYAMYLSHPFALNIVTMIWRTAHLPAIRHLYFGAMVATAMACGYLTYRVLEMPISRRLEIWRRHGPDFRPAPA